jgi:epsilon-lactone hydrolase
MNWTTQKRICHCERHLHRTQVQVSEAISRKKIASLPYGQFAMTDLSYKESRKMPSLRSRLLIFALKNRHLLSFRLKPEVIDCNTSTVQLREQYEKAALRADKIPAGIEVTPVSADGLTAEWILTKGALRVPKDAARDKVMLYTHGGGYVTGSCQDHRMHVAKFVQGSGVGGFLYDYGLAPEPPHPAAVNDSPTHIVIVGESAGGGLCLALLLAIRDSGLLSHD